MNTDQLIKELNKKIQSLKDLSAEDVKIFFDENVSLVLSISIITILIIILCVFANLHFKERNNLQAQLVDLRAKEDPVKEQEKIRAECISFQKSLRPSIAEDQLISYVTTLAEKRKIIIGSFDPVQNTTKSFFVESSLVFSCTTRDFSNAMLFIKDLEDSKYFIKVDNINMSKVVVTDGNDPEHTMDIKFNIKLSAVKLLDDGTKNSQN